MSLVTNTQRLLDSTGAAEEGARIEYELLSWRELYDGSIITADRHSSGAGEWVIRGDRRFYTVTVASRPFYSLPQHLTLSFYCFSETKTVGSATTMGPPVERVALEFCVLLSVFAREAITPLGVRRWDDKPLVETPHHRPPQPVDRATQRPVAINSPEFGEVPRGLVTLEPATVNAVLGAAKFYHMGLAMIGFDPSIALCCDGVGY